MPLSDTTLRNAKPKEKQYKLYDADGPFVIVTPKANKWWRFKYRFDGKEKLLSLGTYPEVSLKDARERRDAARKLVAQGIDPSENRQTVREARVARLANTFEAVSREWFEKHVSTLDPLYGKKLRSRFEKHIFPVIGNKAISELEPTDVLAAAQRTEREGSIETSHRILQHCSQVFRYAIATGRTKYDVTVGLHDALAKTKVKHMATILDKERIGQLLRAIDAYGGFYPTKCALRLAPHFFVRPGELQKAEWAEFDMDAREWRIPAEKMKMRAKHIVPLSRQAVEILQELHPHTGNGRFLFPSIRTNSKPISLESMLVAIRAKGFTKDEMTIHGFRGMASTLLNEMGYNRDWIERQLAHSERDHVRAAYNYAQYLPERTRMMQEWSDYLDILKSNQPCPEMS